MQAVQIHNGFFLVFSKGEEFMAALQEFCDLQKVHWAEFHGIGTVEQVEIGYYAAAAREYVLVQEEGPFEVVSLSGNVAETDEEPMVHAHAVLSRADESLSCIGGHIRSMQVALTLEVTLWEVTQPLIRGYDDETGLNLINLGI